jgi:site-specific DNA-cytosine methylase
MELFGLVDLVISGWECQGFSMAGFGEGLCHTRSSLFTNMVQLITWVQSIFPMFGYVIENTPSQFDQREKVQEHYTLVKHYLGKSFLLDAAQCGSYAHRCAKRCVLLGGNKGGPNTSWFLGNWFLENNIPWKQQVVGMAYDAFWIEKCTCLLSTSHGLGSRRGRFHEVLHR